MATMLPKYLELSKFFLAKKASQLSVLECYQGNNKSHPFEVRNVNGIAQQESSSLEVSQYYFILRLSKCDVIIFSD